MSSSFTFFVSTFDRNLLPRSSALLSRKSTSSTCCIPTRCQNSSAQKVIVSRVEFLPLPRSNSYVVSCKAFHAVAASNSSPISLSPSLIKKGTWKVPVVVFFRQKPKSVCGCHQPSMRLHNQRKDKPTDPASCFNVRRTLNDAVLLLLYYYSMLDMSSKVWLKAQHAINAYRYPRPPPSHHNPHHSCH